MTTPKPLDPIRATRDKMAELNNRYNALVREHNEIVTSKRIADALPDDPRRRHRPRDEQARSRDR